MSKRILMERKLNNGRDAVADLSTTDYSVPCVRMMAGDCLNADLTRGDKLCSLQTIEYMTALVVL